jgi:hypothetical protein
MPIKIDLPPDKLSDPDVLKLYNEMQEIFENNLAVNSFCVHEAGHVIYYQRAGVPIHSIAGPRITYQNGPLSHPAEVRVLKADVEALGKSPETVFKIAKVHAAGKIFAIRLTAVSVGGEKIDQQNFRDYCDSIPISENERGTIWDDAEKEIEKEIAKPANRKEAWNEAYKIRLQLLGIPHPLGNRQ